ncbi:MAG: HD domain-containing phosphohydrolase [Myxococcota bacterium]
MPDSLRLPLSHHEQARQAILHQLGVIQAVERDGSQGRPFLDALAGWQVSLLELTNRTGLPLELRLVEDTLWVNDRMLSAEARTAEAIGHLQARLHQRAVGGLRWTAAPSVEILRHWILRFGQPMRAPTDSARIRMSLEELAPYGLHTLDPQMPSVDEQTMLRVHGVRFARGALARLSVAFAGFVNMVFEARDPFTFPLGLTRPLLDLVEVVEAAPDHLAWVLAGRRARASAMHDALGGYAPVHAAATAAYSILLGAGLRLDREQLLDLGASAVLSKVPFALLPPEMTEKPGPMNREDRYAMQLAMVRAVQHLLRSSRYGEATLRRLVVAYEHQRPFALDSGKRTDTHVYARIVAVADAFDALTTPRPWRPEHGVFDAIRQLRQEAGKRYDPVFVEAIDGLTRTTA